MCEYNLKCIEHIWNVIHFWKCLFCFYSRLSFLLGVCFSLFCLFVSIGFLVSLIFVHALFLSPCCLLAFLLACFFSLHYIIYRKRAHVLNKIIHCFIIEINVLPLNTSSQWAILTLKDWRTISNVNYSIFFCIFVFNLFTIQDHALQNASQIMQQEEAR